MRIKPLADHVVLKNVEVEVTTASGLILAGAAVCRNRRGRPRRHGGRQGSQDGSDRRPEGHLSEVCRHRSQDREAGVHHRSSERYPGYP